ncbi:hypothetical protein Ctob_013424 [Chrysochromulina tobinii]|uniref:Uncharacterized protein n=1 Tax=Chrysochromulina tobinii TaxID=1460289 RepID=A0A0M0K6I0_9EUKA|nr:hypothetical protein Ctob_013424 [Chrysochromulina tobinii]|eukprot:KOO34414.1 hypothetical protein Ctob_013424 [Chrysochromulina sp. CCMP291]
MIPAPCLKDPRCARAQGHSGICRMVKLPGFDDALPAALEFVPGPMPEGDGTEADQAQLAHINPYRCTRHHLCVRGRKHPGLCKMLDAYAPVIDRILGKASTTIYLQGRPVSQQVYLVQHEGRSRAQAIWEPATRILDDLAFQAFENEIEPGRRLCNTFGCTLLNNHFGLHKLPSVENNEGRQKRQSSQINFRKLASKGLERAEIGQGRQLGKPDAVLERMREKKKAMRLPEPEPLLRPHEGISALLAGEDLAELEDDADADADADEEVWSAGQKIKRHKSETDGGEAGGGGSIRSRPNHKFGIGSRVRYLRPGSAQGCGGTIVDAKCGYWVVSIDGGPRAPVYARASMLESLEGGEVAPAGSARDSALYSSQAQGAVSGAMVGLSARAASKQREDMGAEDMGGDGSFSCGYCGRKLANAGSHANHERACAAALQLKVYPNPNRLIAC